MVQPKVKQMKKPELLSLVEATRLELADLSITLAIKSNTEDKLNLVNEKLDKIIKSLY